jgi:hypothetical protein
MDIFLLVWSMATSKSCLSTTVPRKALTIAGATATMLRKTTEAQQQTALPAAICHARATMQNSVADLVD